RDDRRALEHHRGRRGHHARATGALPAGRGPRRRQRSRGDGSGVPAGWQHVVPAREPPGRVLARSPRGGPGGHARAGVVPDRRSRLPEDGSGAAAALARDRRETSPSRALLLTRWTRREIWPGITPLITAAATFSSLPGAGLAWSPSRLDRVAPGPRRRARPSSRSAVSGPDAWAAPSAPCSSRPGTP